MFLNALSSTAALLKAKWNQVPSFSMDVRNLLLASWMGTVGIVNVNGYQTKPSAVVKRSSTKITKLILFLVFGMSCHLSLWWNFPCVSVRIKDDCIGSWEGTMNISKFRVGEGLEGLWMWSKGYRLNSILSLILRQWSKLTRWYWARDIYKCMWIRHDYSPGSP